MKKIDEDFIIDLKLELDEKFGGDEDEFKIEIEWGKLNKQSKRNNLLFNK